MLFDQEFKERRKQTAVLRARSVFHVFQQAYVDAQPGDKTFAYVSHIFDSKTAQEKAIHVEKLLLKAAAKAQVDRFGAPLH